MKILVCLKMQKLMGSVLEVCQDDDIYHLLFKLYPTYKFITSNNGRELIEYLKTKVNVDCLLLTADFIQAFIRARFDHLGVFETLR